MAISMDSQRRCFGMRRRYELVRFESSAEGVALASTDRRAAAASRPTCRTYSRSPASCSTRRRRSGPVCPLLLPLRHWRQVAEDRAWLAAHHPGRVAAGFAAAVCFATSIWPRTSTSSGGSQSWKHLQPQPRQPGGALPHPGPVCGGGDASQTGGGDLGEGPGTRPPECGHGPQQPGVALRGPRPVRGGGSVAYPQQDDSGEAYQGEPSEVKGSALITLRSTTFDNRLRVSRPPTEVHSERRNSS
jgi:hypothetical protein